MTRTVSPYAQTAAASAANITHGLSKSRIYRLWKGMIARCKYKNSPNFPNYGGRGIKVCKRWENFENFLCDMGRPPEGYQLDRINNDGDYEPSNCRWVTVKDNSRNRRTNRNITFFGVTKCITDWAGDIGITRSALYRRIDILSWPLEKALTQGKK